MKLVGKYLLSIVEYPSLWLSVISWRVVHVVCCMCACVVCSPLSMPWSRLTTALSPKKDLVRIQKTTIDVTARNSVLGDIT